MADNNQSQRNDKELCLIAVSAVLMTMTLIITSWMNSEIQLLGLTAAMMIGVALAIYIAKKTDHDAYSFSYILTLALFLRLIALFAQPILEDDQYRYLWDGYRFSVSGTPYGDAPASFFGDELVPPAFQNILNFINYPDIPTIYGPMLQWLFRFAYFLSPGNVSVLQELNVLIDSVIILLLWQAGAKQKYLLLYAISPLVLKESIITTHPDGLMTLLALSGLLWARRFWISGGLLGLAIASKISAIIFLPFLLQRGGGRALCMAIAVLIGIYLPFIIMPGSDMTALFNFAQNWRFNPLLYLVIEKIFSANWTRAVTAACLIFFLFGIYWQDILDSAKRVAPADLALGALLLLSPVVNPWYLLWILPFSVLRPTRSVWVASFVLLLSYWNGTNSTYFVNQQFEIPSWISFIEILFLSVAIFKDFLYPLKEVPSP